MVVEYTNRVTGESTRKIGLVDIGEAWDIADEICREMNWNEDTFAIDVRVKEVK